LLHTNWARLSREPNAFKCKPCGLFRRQPVSWTTPPSSEDVSAKAEMAPPALVHAGGGVPCVEGSFVERCRLEASRLAVHSPDPRRTPALRNPGAVRVGLVKAFRRAVSFGPEPVAKVAYVLQHYETVHGIFRYDVSRGFTLPCPDALTMATSRRPLRRPSVWPTQGLLSG
jgi:hypothetical protein